ncbi:MAG: ABC transporter permease [Dehalococcoidia bacterium]
MTRYLVRSVLGAVPTLLILIFAVSLLVRLIPGSAVDVLLTESGAKASDRKDLERQLGLDRSLAHQYVVYLRDVASGTLGRSLFDQRPVIAIVKARALPTIELAVLSLTISSALGVLIGVISAARRNTRLDYSLRLFVNLFLGVPNFVLATVIVLLPAYYWGWSPPLSYVRLVDNPGTNLVFFIAPSVTLGVALSATMARITRTQTLEVINQDYIRTAHAKGLTEITVLRRHALRNALLPVLTLFGIQVAVVLSGTVVIEQVFSIPGLGTLLLQKIRERDYPVVQGITLLSGLIVVALNLLLDLCYTALDPRVRVG